MASRRTWVSSSDHFALGRSVPPSRASNSCALPATSCTASHSFSNVASTACERARNNRSHPGRTAIRRAASRNRLRTRLRVTAWWAVLRPTTKAKRGCGSELGFARRITKEWARDLAGSRSALKSLPRRIRCSRPRGLPGPFALEEGSVTPSAGAFPSSGACSAQPCHPRFASGA